MLERLSRGRRNAALAVLAILVLWFAWSIRSVLNPLLIGYLLAYILHPVVERVQGRRLSRRGAVNLTFAVGALFFLLVGLGLLHQTRALVRDVITNEQMGDLIQERWNALHGELREVLPEEVVPDRQGLAGDLNAAWRWIRSEVGGGGVAAVKGVAQTGLAGARDVFGWVRRVAAWLFGIGGLVVLVPLYTYYLLFELDRVHGFFGRYVPKRERARVARVGNQVGEVLAHFFRGRLLVCVLKGALLTVGLFVADVPYAFLLGMGSGFLSLIPAVGPLIGFVGAFLLGVLVGEHSFVGSLVRTGLVFGLAELVEGYVLIPKVLGDSLGLHPVVVLFSLLAGGAALGLFGVLVALPLTASLVILAREFVLPALGRFADEDPLESSTVPVGDAAPSREDD